jgi:hypothetical protein
MKFSLFASGLLLAAVLPLQGQVTVDVVLDQDQYLPAEQLLAGVRIVNRSGQTLHLGEEADWLQFSFEKVEGGGLEKLENPPVQGGFDLAATKQATVRVDLAPCYDLREQGRYFISATVKIKDWNQAIVTKQVPFSIIEGTKLWEQSFGVPRQDAGGRPPETRKYALQQANYLKNQLRLYLRVSASDDRVIKLINVGPMISFGQPEPQVDAQSRLHLLYQSGARTFTYLVVDPDGEVLVRQTHDYTETRPRLRPDDNGQIAVVGGARHLAADDLPKATSTKPAAPVPAPAPVPPPVPALKP